MARCIESVSAHSSARRLFLSVFIQDLLALFQHPLVEQLNFYWLLHERDERGTPRCGLGKRSSWSCGNGFTVLPSLWSAVWLHVLVESSRWHQLGCVFLLVPSFWHKNIWSYFSFPLLFFTWRCQTNANCFGQGYSILCQRGMQERKGFIGISVCHLW